MKKVLFITNVEVPYRMDFFNEFGKTVDLTVLFHQTAKEQTHRSGAWFNKKANNFIPEYLYDEAIRYKNPFRIIHYLKGHRKESIIISGFEHVPVIIAILWLWIHRTPFLIVIDGGFIKFHHDRKKLLKRFLISRASGFLSTGTMADDYFRYYGAKQDIYRYPLTTLFAKDILKEPLMSDEKEKYRHKIGITEKNVVVSVGQFIYRKGYDVLLKSATLLSSDIGIYIIGSLATEEYVNYKEKHHLDNVHFVGFKNKEDLSEYYKAADLFVLPTREDIWGLVINEAMAYGLPIITTDRCIAGLELVDEKNGQIVPVGDYNSLAKAILHFFEQNTNLRREMSVKSLKKIAGYTIENMAKIHHDIITDFVNKHDKV